MTQARKWCCIWKVQSRFSGSAEEAELFLGTPEEEEILVVETRESFEGR